MAESTPRPASAADTPATAREAGRVFLAHASPRVLIATLLVALAARVALGGWSAWDLVPIAVVGLWWPLQEWLIHVCILHWKPRRIGSLELDFAVPRSHRAHHRDPWRTDLVFIPVHSFLYSIPLMAALCIVLTPSPELATTAICIYLAGALHYEAVHFLVHTRVSPRTGYYRRLWRNHRLHHFRNEHYWYGVTRLEADRWLGTAPDADAVPLSGTARAVVAER